MPHVTGATPINREVVFLIGEDDPGENSPSLSKPKATLSVEGVLMINSRDMVTGQPQQDNNELVLHLVGQLVAPSVEVMRPLQGIYLYIIPNT